MTYDENLREVVKTVRGDAISRGKCLELLMEHYASRCTPLLTRERARAAVDYIYNTEPPLSLWKH